MRTATMALLTAAQWKRGYSLEKGRWNHNTPGSVAAGAIELCIRFIYWTVNPARDHYTFERGMPTMSRWRLGFF